MPRGPQKRARAGQRLSQRGLARRLGVDPKAVRKAIASGRLKAAIGPDGKLDAAIATKEWAAGAGKPNTKAESDSGAPAESDSGAPGAPVEISLIEAQKRVALQREKQLRLSNRQKRGALIDAAEVRREQFACARAVRDTMLGIPDRVSGELAAESDPARVHGRLLEEIRHALVGLHEALSDGE